MRGFPTLNPTSCTADPCLRKGGKAILSKFKWYTYIHTYILYADSRGKHNDRICAVLEEVRRLSTKFFACINFAPTGLILM